MPANRFNGYTDYGVGIGLRVPHYDHILSKKPVVDWFETISENYMIDGGRPLKILDQILDQYRVVQHGVSMYFGSAQPLNRDHLKRIKELTKRTKTPWLSDHLCWGSVDGRIHLKRFALLRCACAWYRTISKFPLLSKTSVAMRNTTSHR
jgi:uncharacterized protein (UPF0276 family)